MSQYTTRYKTENGKTRKLFEAAKEPVKEAGVKGTDKNGAPGLPGADGKTNRTESPTAKQEGNT